jgi:hypothetical protein
MLTVYIYAKSTFTAKCTYVHMYLRDPIKTGALINVCTFIHDELLSLPTCTV